MIMTLGFLVFVFESAAFLFAHLAFTATGLPDSIALLVILGISGQRPALWCFFTLLMSYFALEITLFLHLCFMVLVASLFDDLDALAEGAFQPNRSLFECRLLRQRSCIFDQTRTIGLVQVL